MSIYPPKTTAMSQNAASNDAAKRDIVAELRAENPEIIWTGDGGLFSRAADEIERLREIKILDSDQYDISDKLTDLQNERDWALTDVERLRGVLAEISAARTDSCLVHELVQQGLGFDPDLEIKP